MKTKAYSLIEMLAVIIIMGILTIIGVVAFEQFTLENKENLNTSLEKTVKDAIHAYCTVPDNESACGIYNPLAVPITNQSKNEITLKQLVDAKLLEGELKDHVTNNKLCLEESYVIVTPTGEYTYDYEFSLAEATADYVCNGT